MDRWDEEKTLARPEIRANGGIGGYRTLTKHGFVSMPSLAVILLPLVEKPNARSKPTPTLSTYQGTRARGQVPQEVRTKQGSAFVRFQSQRP